MKKFFSCLPLFPKCQLPLLIITTGLVFMAAPPALNQEKVSPTQPSAETVNASENGLYFADVLVKGRPIFQIGSLPSLNAGERAKIINRRIAVILAQSKLEGRVEVKSDIPLAIDVGQRLYETVRQLLGNTIDNLPSLLGGIVMVGITWGVAKGVRHAAFTWAQQTEGDSSTEILIGRLSYGGVWVLGSVIALGILGVDFGALLGALGLTSVAIGFSLKDVLSNYISGVILLVARPFKIRDQVVIDNYEGTITQIQLRATTLKTYDGRLVYIPNQEIFQASIINNTASPRRRSSVMVGIDYAENINQAKQIIFQVFETIEEVETDPAPDILVSELAASTVFYVTKNYSIRIFELNFNYK